MRKKFFSWISLTLLVALLLPGCGALPKPSKEHPPIKVEYTLWDGDYTLLIAQEKGFFEKHGVQVEPVFYETFSRAIPDIAAKRIDIGLFSIGDLLMVTQVADVLGVAVYDSGGTSVVATRPEIKDVAGLKGKKIGVNIGSSSELFIRHMLKSANLDVGDVALVEINPEDVPGKLSSNEIAAGYVWAPYDKKALEAGHHLLYTNHEVGSLFPDVITVREELAAKRPEDVRAFLAAWFEAVDYRLNHPAESNEIIARLTNQPVSDVIANSSTIKLYTKEENIVMYDVLGVVAKDDNIFQSARANLEFQITTGSLTRGPDLAALLDPKYLP